MGGYRGEGYGMHGDVAGEGSAVGRSEADAGRREEARGEGADPRAIRAAEAYRDHYGIQGHEGQYGGGAMMNFGRHRDAEPWDGERERRHNFSGVGRFGTGHAGSPHGGGLHDDPYLNWRDRHIAELDRDYEEYCREHGQQFSSAFESWRQQRQNQGSAAMPDAGGARPGDPVSSAPGSAADVQGDQLADKLSRSGSEGAPKRRRR